MNGLIQRDGNSDVRLMNGSVGKLLDEGWIGADHGMAV